MGKETTKPKITGVQTENTSTPRDRVSIILMFIHVLFLLAAIVLVIQIVKLTVFYKPPQEYEKQFSPTTVKVITQPVRGSILTYDGKLLATSVPYYNVFMDCTVRKTEFQNKIESGEQLIKDGEALIRRGRRYSKEGQDCIDRGNRLIEEGQNDEALWLRRADTLSHELAEIVGQKTAEEYFKIIKTGREKNRKYVSICKKVDFSVVEQLRKATLFNQGKFRSGYIEVKEDRREYPYGSLARRTIGSVAINAENNSLIGIEGKYDFALKGREGVEWLTRTDNRNMIRSGDSTMVRVRNGSNVRTTLNIEFQDIVDEALRKKILENDIIEGGCAIVMEVETGAIRALVNLKRNEDGMPAEIYNYAAGRAGDPGSVFKLVTLMTLIEDGKVTSLETKVPTYGGHWTYNGKNFEDPYLKRRGESEISIINGFKISSNNVFRYLACKYYGENPKRFMEKLYEYKLTEAFDFDLIGLASPTMPLPDTPSWSGTSLPSISIGYSVTETPLHIIMLYNAVANKGKMMKPYLVECTERDGKVEQKYGPEVLNGSICSQATADTLLRALCAVTTPGGTGAGLKDAKCKVAGKTGTAQIPFPINEGGKAKVVYKDNAGNRQHQATFVGFFPAEAPKYTAIVVMYSTKGPHNLYGSAGIPVYKEIVNQIYALSEDWDEPLKTKK